MDVSYVNPFIEAVVNVFRTMLKIEIKAGPPRIKKEPFPSYDVSGIIGLSGDAQGSISLSFPKIFALKVVSVMLGSEIKIVGPEVTDGVGELANIVAGNAKLGLTKYNLSISLPSVVIGKDHTIMAPSGAVTILVPFSSTMGDFAVEVCLKTK